MPGNCWEKCWNKSRTVQQKNKRSGSFEPEKLQNNFMHKSFVSCEPCRKFSSAFESLQHFSFFLIQSSCFFLTWLSSLYVLQSAKRSQSEKVAQGKRWLHFPVPRKFEGREQRKKKLFWLLLFFRFLFRLSCRVDNFLGHFLCISPNRMMIFLSSFSCFPFVLFFFSYAV